ncbi:programmed cell death 1 ligand 1-like isoform X2 [Carassius auratus]|uniref:Programmed cell death 1 ligand 1-like isoform X2 n=1 Tax=Carassius auratus TaxID=7957 RepID=A0A6P6J769_CARAU|nr:programmed cell death 1 ligand 1-like isoform X2 [Carassius auratus]
MKLQEETLLQRCIYFICVFTLLINKVSLQVTGDVGGSVVLPCSSTEPDLKPQDINVHWRDKDRKIVYDIVMGNYAQELQDQEYKNRVETFPQEFLKGNVSIKLNNLQHTDAGTYSCIITPSSEHLTVQLIINESSAGNKITDLQNEGEASEADKKSLLWVYIVVGVLIGLVGLIIGLIIKFRKKQFKFSCVKTQ